MVSAVILAIIALILAPLAYWCSILYSHRSLKVIPGPWAIPFLGSLFPKDAFDLFQIIMELQRQYQVTKFKVYIGPTLNVIFVRYEPVESILSSSVQIEKSANYKFLVPWLGEGLLISKGNKWRSRRKLLTPAFHFKILSKFIKSFNIAADELVNQLSKEVGNTSFDIFEIVNFFTLDVICDTAMGVKINAQTNRQQPFAKAVRHFLETFTYRLFTPYAQVDWMFKLTTVYREYSKSLKILQDMTTKVIEDRKMMYKSNEMKQNNIDDSEIGEKRSYALLDLLLTAYYNEDADKLTDDDLRDEINTFLFEGNDTTSSGLSFTLLEIARHPDVQERIYQEIISTVGAESNDLKIIELNELKYLDMVIKEALRMYPSVPVFQRALSEDMWIEGVKYPKGIAVTMIVYLLHRDPEIYPEPDKFDPERFTTENCAKRPPYAYVPFSAGLRNCIGQKFVMYEMKTAIIKILRNFRLLPAPGFKEELGFMAILKPKDGIRIALERRNNVIRIQTNQHQERVTSKRP